MTAIQRNGLSGLALKVAAIIAAAIVFGSAPKVGANAPFTAHAEAAEAGL